MSLIGHICGRSRLIWALFFTLISAAAATAMPACRQVEEESSTYTVCSVEPGEAEIRVHLAGPDGQIHGGFDALRRQLWAERRVLLIGMNAGMYHDDRSPVGYYVEYGRELKAAVTGGGYGNFHLLPNGIFFMRDGRAGVMETKAFLASGQKPDFATQSGPMLVIDGKLHPRFVADSDSFKVRNGVGVDAEGRVHLVLSNRPVRFYDFARFFRDRLQCRNALYLDGTVSSLFEAATGRRDRLFPMGPILSVSMPIPQ